MGIVVKGKPVADAITEKVKEEVDSLKGKGIVPKLAIVLVPVCHILVWLNYSSLED